MQSTQRVAFEHLAAMAGGELKPWKINQTQHRHSSKEWQCYRLSKH
jgi:hypothetical protein